MQIPIAGESPAKRAGPSQLPVKAERRANGMRAPLPGRASGCRILA
jgi:hypothetical protein